ncbi:leucyl aminopeptidase [Candidatus Gottesmanbacteria bacterium]|nr:leucyl aminopeptidase [Candidatus Gottesmanbacteria bacterium]
MRVRVPLLALMVIYAKAIEVTKVDADIVAVFVWSGKKEKEIVWSEEAKKVDVALGGILSEVATTEDFEAKQGATLLIHSHGKIPAKRILLVGLGNVSEMTMFDLQTIGATIGRVAKKVASKRVAVALAEELFDVFDKNAVSQGMVEGIRLGTYSFIKHKSEEEQKKEKIIDEVWLLASARRLDAVSDGIGKGQMVADAVLFARDLVNEAPSTTTPTYLATVAKNIAKADSRNLRNSQFRESRVTAEALGPAEMEKLGMGALLGVARGSDEEPRFIKLVYDGGGRKTVALIGKGITFDTGGLSLKDAKNMETMKLDMAGAATILAVFSVLSILKPKAKVVGLISATENMPGPKAVKPGDVVRAMNGKTIEILNTDAEGRVVLADALSFAAEKIKPDTIIDLATLTGACMVALGHDYAGLFVNNEELAKKIEEASKTSGERLWRLPLVKEYRELLKSTIADIQNVGGGRYGGAITGALFLADFVPEKTPWAHLDIAGPSFAEKDAPLTPVGGTGYGVRLLLGYLSSFI